MPFPRRPHHRHRDDYTVPSHRSDAETAADTTSFATFATKSFGSFGYNLKHTNKQQHRCGGFSCFFCCCSSSSSSPREESVLTEEEHLTSSVTGIQSRRLFRLALLANACFVLGSTALVLDSLKDFQWVQSVQEIPIEVLKADDDATWEAYQRSQQNHAERHGAQRQLYDWTALPWHYLPYEEKHALVVLGQTEKTWNGKGDVQSQLPQATWQELTREQQEAAQLLGFDPEKWNQNINGDENESDTAEEEDLVSLPPQAEPEPEPATSFLGNVEQYEDYAQENLNQNDEAASESIMAPATTDSPTASPTNHPTSSPTTSSPTLSPTSSATTEESSTQTSTQEEEIYPEDDGEHPSSEATRANATDVLQEEPTREQQDMAQIAQEDVSTETTTNATQQDTTDTSAMTLPPDQDWKDINWNYLPQNIRTPYETLGYNQELWETKGTPYTKYLFWKELSQEQRDAATSLKYREKTWDKFRNRKRDHLRVGTLPETDAPFSYNATTPVPHPDQDWIGIKWNYLPQNIRTAYETLGYNYELWQAEGTPYTQYLFWKELTQEQRDAASSLNYTQIIWDHFKDKTRDDLRVGLGGKPKLPQEAETNATHHLFRKPHTPAPKESKGPKAKATTEAPSLKPVAIPEPTPPPTEKAAKKQSKATPSPTTTPTNKPTPKPTTAKPTKSPYVSNDDLAVLFKEDYFGDDDVVLTVGSFAEIELTLLLQAVAALCFLVCGIMNWIRDAQVFHVCMVQGALSTLLSSACIAVHSFIDFAPIFELLAYHCYLLEGVYLLRLRKSIQPLEGLETLSMGLWVADGLFGAGAVIGVVLGYWQFLNEDAQFDLDLICAKLLSACLWLVASTICLLSTIVLSKKKRIGAGTDGLSSVGGYTDRFISGQDRLEDRSLL